MKVSLHTALLACKSRELNVLMDEPISNGSIGMGSDGTVPEWATSDFLRVSRYAMFRTKPTRNGFS